MTSVSAGGSLSGKRAPNTRNAPPIAKAGGPIGPPIRPAKGPIGPPLGPLKGPKGLHFTAAGGQALLSPAQCPVDPDMGVPVRVVRHFTRYPELGSCYRVDTFRVVEIIWI
jgi:hypothetical protein